MPTRPRYIVSACLAGLFCRYDGSVNAHPQIVEMIRRGDAVPVCPEQIGGLTTPRPPCERLRDRVVNSEGVDVTEQFERGAQHALALARMAGCTHAVLKARSPSCGIHRVYDGTFSSTVIEGHGVFAALLLENGFTVVSEQDL